ncbi:alpha/beta-hydrolase [Laetiporus sulphureus 93-53]|uniref:Alpha/beta-hydrolase n=1 Tax=Laetiporus sulphureus 93-53 TaxID=1314785 RepID=A0A165FK64_9APHY|nr:alpha/beta-hydrolase [Laetiporus sulphureus 93-53]KZT09096.1 alpha/beta-hydrolase [Laetiporus sulphureus 93-53]
MSIPLPEPTTIMSVEPQPFTIAVPDSELELLHKKLDLVRLPDELDGAGWDYGAPLEDIRRLVARWKDGYDWRKAEEGINQIPQFTRNIIVDGFGTLNIHYAHQKSSTENAIPLLFIHGWPGHFLEVGKMLPLLTAASPDHPSFHVVALSLPGFGFSEAPKKKGFAGRQYAEVAHRLMVLLGYDEYVIQGGDWGSYIAKIMAHVYGKRHVKAWHTNFPTAPPPSFRMSPARYLSFLMTPFTFRERTGLDRSEWFESKGSGFFREQSTQPQTIGYSLADSPVGLLAWIYEKLVQWADEYPWEDDEVLTWISVYWFSRAGPAASVRIYYEVMAVDKLPFVRSLASSVPLGLSFFPKEVLVVPKAWTHFIGNVVMQCEHDSGGHFAAHERPGELAGDIRRMFAKDGPAYAVVEGKNGYEGPPALRPTKSIISRAFSRMSSAG